MQEVWFISLDTSSAAHSGPRGYSDSPADGGAAGRQKGMCPAPQINKKTIVFCFFFAEGVAQILSQKVKWHRGHPLWPV